MFLGRTQELKQLEEIYRLKRNTAVVLYGKLGNRYVSWDTWYGKTGYIDVVADDLKGNIIVMLF